MCKNLYLQFFQIRPREEWRLLNCPSVFVGILVGNSVGTNLKIANLELPEPSENRTLNLLNLNSSSETKLRTSQKPNLEPYYIYRIAKNG